MGKPRKTGDKAKDSEPTTNSDPIGSQQPAETPDESHVDTDVTINPGETARDGTELRTETKRLRRELDRLRVELRMAQDQAELARAEASAARSMMRDSTQSLNSVSSHMDELKEDAERSKKDADRYQRARDNAERRVADTQEDWQLDSVKLTEEIDNLRQENYELQNPRAFGTSTPSVPNRQSDGDNTSGFEDYTPATRPAISQSSAQAASQSVTSSTASTKTVEQNTFSGVTRGTSAFPNPGKAPASSGPNDKRGIRPLDRVPPVKFDSPGFQSGLASSHWSDKPFTQSANLKRRSQGDLANSFDRHAPRSGTGFGTGFSRGRGGTKQSSAARRTKDNTRDEDLEWTGRFMVHTHNPVSANTWRVLSAQGAIALFTGPNAMRVDPDHNRLQQTLVHHARMIPRDRLSAAQQQVLDLARNMENMGDHLIMRTEQVPTGVRIGENTSISAMDMSVHRFLLAVRPTGARELAPIINRVNHVLGEIFSRPQTYRHIVETIVPGVSEDIYSDPLNVTSVTDTTRISAVHFPDVSAVDYMSVGRWLWEVLRVPRLVVHHVLEPYFRRGQRHTLANRALARLNDAVGIADSDLEWIQHTTALVGSAGRSSFLVHAPARFPVRDLNRIVWGNLEMTCWRWMLPAPSVPSAVPATAVEILRSDVSYLDVNVRVDWVPESIRAVFLPTYESDVTAWEQTDVIHTVPTPGPDGAPFIDDEPFVDGTDAMDAS
ncbi:hypothetical protein BDV93DRAFT_562143 [Ceratobasidium sp. AG-I]|nr:hypothetical protein BDV93DRAFT_562143 [Ceratobasidium sp. AG-I]